MLLDDENFNMLGDHSAFFYGTLMAPNVLARVLNGDSSIPTSHLHIVPAILHNHTRYKVAHADYPGIIPSPITSSSTATATRVRGVFVSGLTSYDLKNLDIFEGSQYERRKVMVALLDVEGDLKGKGHIEGMEVECDTYVFVAGDELLEDKEWCFEEFVKEKLYRWADSSEEYEDLDNAMESDEESDYPNGHDPTGGRGLGSNMDAQLRAASAEPKSASDPSVLDSAV